MLFWQACDLIRPWNNARKDIKWKMDAPMTGDIGGFWFAETNKILGSVMAGYDAIAGASIIPRPGVLSAIRFWQELMRKVKQGLTFAGCLKINLLIRKGNKAVTSSMSVLIILLTRSCPFAAPINDH